MPSHVEITIPNLVLGTSIEVTVLVRDDGTRRIIKAAQTTLRGKTSAPYTRSLALDETSCGK